jgi:hypothetical protein
VATPGRVPLRSHVLVVNPGDLMLDATTLGLQSSPVQLHVV